MRYWLLEVFFARRTLYWIKHYRAKRPAPPRINNAVRPEIPTVSNAEHDIQVIIKVTDFRINLSSCNYSAQTGINMNKDNFDLRQPTLLVLGLPFEEGGSLGGGPGRITNYK